MKTLARILIVLNFAAIIFIPSIYTNRLTMIPMFLLMFALVAFYWYAMFWVSKKDVKKVLKSDDLNVFVGKIPADTTADLLRGRLCKVEDRLALMQRTSDKEHAKTPCKEAWSIKVDSIKSVGFGKVLPGRKGFILYTEDDDEISFTSGKIAKDKKILYKLLGWKVPEDKALD
ncbi:MAG: hypothetical protein HUK23_07995 [Sphaerochaetaceae bacterium]|nr:hypothetical protein [Sphaerochaetaceae bacterium]